MDDLVTNCSYLTCSEVQLEPINNANRDNLQDSKFRKTFQNDDTVAVHVVGGSRSGKSYKVGRGGACTKKTPPAQYSLTLRGKFKLQALFYNSFFRNEGTLVNWRSV